MTCSLLLVLLASPAAANPAAMSAALEAFRLETGVDPAELAAQEGAATRAGRSFDRSLLVQTLTPVELDALDGAPRKDHLPAQEAKPPDYHFEGKRPLNGITIYTPIKGAGSTAGGDSSSEKYGKYGKYAVLAGIGLGVAGLALGGVPLVALALAAGFLIGAGAVLSFLFGKRK